MARWRIACAALLVAVAAAFAVDVDLGRIEDLRWEGSGLDVWSTFEQVAAATGLLLQYLFNSDDSPTATDTSGNGNDGTIYGGEWVAATNTISAHWYATNGSTDRVESTTTGATVCAWANTNGVWAHYAVIGSTTTRNAQAASYVPWTVEGDKLTWGSNTTARFAENTVRSDATNVVTALESSRTNWGWSVWYHTNALAGSDLVADMQMMIEFESPFGLYAQDSTPYGNDATIGSSLGYTNLGSSFAMGYDGDDYCTAPDMVGAWTQLTVGCWCFATAANADAVVSQWQTSGGPYKSFGLWAYNGGTTYFVVSKTASASTLRLVSAVTNITGRWVLLGGTYDGTDTGSTAVKLWVDAGVVDQDTKNTIDAIYNVTTGEPISIGQRSTTDSGYFTGWLDRPFVINGEWTGQQWTNYFNQTCGDYGRSEI